MSNFEFIENSSETSLPPALQLAQDRVALNRACYLAGLRRQQAIADRLPPPLQYLGQRQGQPLLVAPGGQPFRAGTTDTNGSILPGVRDIAAAGNVVRLGGMPRVIQPQTESTTVMGDYLVAWFGVNSGFYVEQEPAEQRLRAEVTGIDPVYTLYPYEQIGSGVNATWEFKAKSDPILISSTTIDLTISFNDFNNAPGRVITEFNFVLNTSTVRSFSIAVEGNMPTVVASGDDNADIWGWHGVMPANYQVKLFGQEEEGLSKDTLLNLSLLNGSFAAFTYLNDENNSHPQSVEDTVYLSNQPVEGVLNGVALTGRDRFATNLAEGVHFFGIYSFLDQPAFFAEGLSWTIRIRLSGERFTTRFPFDIPR